jgi:hypothetical protein
LSVNGGDATVAWRIVSLIRERVNHFAILIPQAAFSAATLIALGANEVVMHPNGNLGPTDPQITNIQKQTRFGSEDVRAFLRFAREEVGLTDQKPLRDLFLKFSEEVGFVGVGVAARSAQLTVGMAENMLRLHMTGADAAQNARAIAESLGTKYFHHGYPLSRSEAKTIGLSVVDRDPEFERLLWAVWSDIEDDLKLREVYSPLGLVRDNAACTDLFSPVPQMHIPPGAPPQLVQALIQQFLAQTSAQVVPPTPFDNTLALMESTRLASRFRSSGSIFAFRQPDLEFKIQVVSERVGWLDVPVLSQRRGRKSPKKDET